MKQATLILSFVMALALSGCNSSKENTKPAPAGSVRTIDVEEFATTITRNDVRIIDVRTAKEFADGHIAEAENKDVNQAGFGNDIVLDKGRKARNVIAVYCRSGKRSLKAAGILSQKGFTVLDLGGGILA